MSLVWQHLNSCRIVMSCVFLLCVTGMSRVFLLCVSAMRTSRVFPLSVTGMVTSRVCSSCVLLVSMVMSRVFGDVSCVTGMVTSRELVW